MNWNEFWIIAVKRLDGKVYADLSKSNGKIYLTEEDALADLPTYNKESWPGQPDSWHVVRMLATVVDDKNWILCDECSRPVREDK